MKKRSMKALKEATAALANLDDKIDSIVGRIPNFLTANYLDTLNGVIRESVAVLKEVIEIEENR